MTKFGERLKLLRTENNLNQSQLAEMLSVDQRTVSNWEKSTREPDYEMLVKIARCLDVTSDYLLGLED